MAERYGLTQENKGAVDSALDFTKLSLKKSEVARLAIFGIEEKDGKKSIVLPEPEGGYTFRLESVEGRFIGEFECLADEATKREDGFDPDACPHCEAVQRGVSEDIVGKRRRRFVLPVYRYNTKGKSSEVTHPIAGQVVAWRFTDRYFNTLVDEHIRWQGTGGLLKHDVSLLCEVEEYQTFKISVEPEAVWLSSREVSQQVIQTYLEALKDIPQGLVAQIGRRFGKDDLAKRIAEAEGSVGADVPNLTAEDAESISHLAEDMFGSTGAIPDPAVAEAVAEAKESTPAAAEGDGESADALDFDEFFASS